MFPHHVSFAKHLVLALLVLAVLFGFQGPVQAAQVSLAWDANNPTPDGYRLFQRTAGGAYNYTTPVWSGSATTCTLTNLADSTTYYFVVRAFAGSEVSGDSNEATFRYDPPSPTAYTITATTGSNGSITPLGGTNVAAGGSQSYTITPNTGYQIAGVLVDGVSVGAVASYTFSAVNANHTISASFTALSYTIGASAGANGSISPAGSRSVAYGGSQSYTITPNTGYQIAGVLVDGVSVGAVAGYTFSAVNANHTISASFTALSYTIGASAGANGSISPAGSRSVTFGGSQSYAISPNTGYRIAGVLVDGVSVGAVAGYTFSAVNANHTISASFTALSYTIGASAGANGSISPSGSRSVTFGGSQSYAISPNTGYRIAGVLVDGVSVGAVPSYTFSAVNANHSISAQFESDNQAPTADAGPDQPATEGQQVTLSGLNSMDNDDGIAAFQWRQIQGMAVTLSNAGTAEASFTAPDVSEDGISLTFELTVTDNNGATAVDTCIVNVTWVNEIPIAQAGSDQTVSAGEPVSLNATGSSDSDDGIAAYCWVQTQGPSVTLSDAAAAQPTFTAPAVGVQGASIAFELTVIDNGGLRDTDTCMVTVEWENAQPVAHAGDDQQVTEGTETTLDGSASMDPDDGIAGYLWKQIDGTAVTLSDAGAIRPVFTAPLVAAAGETLTFQLTVTDTNGLQSVDRCQVFVQEQAPADTVPPTIRIAKPVNTTVKTKSPTITFRGASSDNVEVARVVWANSRGGSGRALGRYKWITDVPLFRGQNYITVTAYDVAGNSASATVLVIAGIPE